MTGPAGRYRHTEKMRRINQAMRAARLLPSVTMLLIFTSLTFSQDIRERFVGKDSCSPQLQKDPFSLRLDKTRNTFLAQRTVDGRDTLMIVQYTAPTDKCGIVRDIVQPHNAKAVFEVNCVNRSHPKTWSLVPLRAGRCPLGIRQRRDGRWMRKSLRLFQLKGRGVSPRATREMMKATIS